MTNTQLEEQLAGQPKDVQAEIIRINTDARPLALQVALLIPIVAGLGGLRELVPDEAPAGPRALEFNRRHDPRIDVVRGAARLTGER